MIRIETAFAVDPTSGLQPVLDELAARFALRSDAAAPRAPRSVVFYDTLDGRLHRGGASLAIVDDGRSGTLGGLALAWKNGSGAVCEARVAGPFACAAELPTGAVRDALERAVAARRVAPLVVVEHRGPAFDVLDKEEKTVVRLRLEEGRARCAREGAEWRELPPVLRAESVRGYDKEWRAVVEVLARRRELAPISGELRGVSSPATGLEVALAALVGACGSSGVGGAVATPLPQLEPDVRADVGLKRVLAAQLEIVRANEGGVRAGLDIEFLHDFRVAVRRSRALLGQFKEVLPAEALERFGPELAWLGAITGPARDLDVFRCDLDLLAGTLADEDVAPLRELLARRSEEAHRTLVRELDSTRYRELGQAWAGFLAEPVAPVPAERNAARAFRDVAAERIDSRYRRILKRGGRIDGQSPAEALHRVRLDCKKLRYVLDAARSLFDETETARIAGELKRFQDNLGVFNDCAVQADTLRELAVELAEEGRASVGALLATGRMIEAAAARARKARGKFEKRLETFAARPNRRLFRRLFGKTNR